MNENMFHSRLGKQPNILGIFNVQAFHERITRKMTENILQKTTFYREHIQYIGYFIGMMKSDDGHDI